MSSLEAEKTTLKEAEDEFRKCEQADRVAHVSLNRGMSSTCQLDGLTNVVEKIQQSQERLEKSIKDIIELFKFVEVKMHKKFEELDNK